MSGNHKEDIEKLVHVPSLWKGTTGNWIDDKSFKNTLRDGRKANVGGTHGGTPQCVF